jgi:hypothetical protein
MESETYRLKISHKTQSERSRNSTAFRSFVRVLRQIRKRDQFELFSSSKRQTRTRKQRNQSTIEGDGYSMHSVICSFGGQGNGGSITIDSRKLTERWLLLEIVAGINHDEASHLRRHFHFRKTDRHRKNTRKEGDEEVEKTDE